MIKRLFHLGILPLLCILIVTLGVYYVGPNRWDPEEQPTLEKAKVTSIDGNQQRLTLNGGDLLRVNVLYIDGKRIPVTLDRSNNTSCTVLLPAGTVSAGSSIRVGKKYRYLPYTLFKSNAVTVSE